MTIAGGYPGYGGGGRRDDYSMNGGGGGGRHGHSNGVRSGMEARAHVVDGGDEYRRLYALMQEVDLEERRIQDLANETQAMLEDRAVARLATEKQVKRLLQEHEEEVKKFREKAREINEQCATKDKIIKELQDRQNNTDKEIEKFVKQRRSMIEQAKIQLREDEKANSRIHPVAGGSSVNAVGAEGATATAAAAFAGTADSRGPDMGRHTHSAVDYHHHGRRASVGPGAGATEGGRGREGKPSRDSLPSYSSSSAQPQKPVEEIRQHCVEDTLTDFFGL